MLLTVLLSIYVERQTEEYRAMSAIIMPGVFLAAHGHHYFDSETLPLARDSYPFDHHRDL